MTTTTHSTRLWRSKKEAFDTAKKARGPARVRCGDSAMNAIQKKTKTQRNGHSGENATRLTNAVVSTTLTATTITATTIQPFKEVNATTLAVTTMVPFEKATSTESVIANHQIPTTTSKVHKTVSIREPPAIELAEYSKMQSDTEDNDVVVCVKKKMIRRSMSRFRKSIDTHPILYPHTPVNGKAASTENCHTSTAMKSKTYTTISSDVGGVSMSITNPSIATAHTDLSSQSRVNSDTHQTYVRAALFTNKTTEAKYQSLLTSHACKSSGGTPRNHSIIAVPKTSLKTTLLNNVAHAKATETWEPTLGTTRSEHLPSITNNSMQNPNKATIMLKNTTTAPVPFGPSQPFLTSPANTTIDAVAITAVVPSLHLLSFRIDTSKTETELASPPGLAYAFVPNLNEASLRDSNAEDSNEFKPSNHSMSDSRNKTTYETDPGFASNRTSSDSSVGISNEPKLHPEQTALVFRCKDTNSQVESAVVPSLYEDSSDLWNEYLTETYNQIAGHQLNADDDFEPIPYHELARGVAVDADNESFTNAHDCPLSAVEAATFASQWEALRRAAQDSAPAQGQAGKTSTMQEGQDEPRIGAGRKIRGAATYRLNLHDDDSDYMDDDCEEVSTKRAKTAVVVGPDSWQMKVVNRMIVYLEEGSEYKHSQLIECFHTVTAQCTALHAKGVHKYLHLPGAIFEEIVELTGGPVFLEIYNAAKTFHHPRLDELRCNDQVLVSHDVTKLKAISTTMGYPNLLQVAVAYGFQLARMRTTNEGQDATDHNNAIKDTVEAGAQDVLDMSEEARMTFWKNNIDWTIEN